MGALLHFLAHLHSSCGPLTGEATEGNSQVMARTAVQLATQLLQPTLAPACNELAALPNALLVAAGGSSDNMLEVDDCLELVLGAWLAQRIADQQQLEMLFKMVNVRDKGIIMQDEFAVFLKQVGTLDDTPTPRKAVGRLLHAGAAMAAGASMAACRCMPARTIGRH